MKAEIKNILSTDIDNLQEYKPADPESFSIQLRVMAGPQFEEGEESFDLTLCTPKWFLDNCSHDDFVIGRHYLIVMEYNFDRIEKVIRSFCDKCDGATWSDVAQKLGRLGHWEFEDYQGSTS